MLQVLLRVMVVPTTLMLLIVHQFHCLKLSHQLMLLLSAELLPLLRVNWHNGFKVDLQRSVVIIFVDVCLKDDLIRRDWSWNLLRSHIWTCWLLCIALFLLQIEHLILRYVLTVIQVRRQIMFWTLARLVILLIIVNGRKVADPELLIVDVVVLWIQLAAVPFLKVVRLVIMVPRICASGVQSHLFFLRYVHDVLLNLLDSWQLGVIIGARLLEGVDLGVDLLIDFL